MRRLEAVIGLAAITTWVTGHLPCNLLDEAPSAAIVVELRRRSPGSAVADWPADVGRCGSCPRLLVCCATRCLVPLYMKLSVAVRLLSVFCQAQRCLSMS